MEIDSNYFEILSNEASQESKREAFKSKQTENKWANLEARFGGK